MYVIFWYGNDSEVYLVLFRVGVSFLLIAVGDSGLLGILVVVLIWPGYMAYLSWMRGVLDRLKLMISVKKIVRAVLLLAVQFLVSGVLYLAVLSGAVRGLLGVVSLSFYLYYLLIGGLWMMILGFYATNLYLNVSYKFIVMGVLPLPLFFLKVGGMFCLYGVMLISCLVLLE